MIVSCDMIAFMNNELNYIAIDFETANMYGNSACSVGLVRFINGKETDSVSTLIHPAKMYFIQEWTDTIHHISYDDVRDKPYFPEVWQNIVEPFISKTPELPFVAHNADFDMGVIKSCCSYFGMNINPINYFDSLAVARRTWPELACHKLTFLGQTFKIDYLAHDALEDSRTCALVIQKAAEKMNVSSIKELLTTCNLGMKRLE